MHHLIDQLSKTDKNVILVHGGGSFGHPIAKQYHLVDGFDFSIENQVMGISETHAAMLDLNSKIIDYFLVKRKPVMPFQPSALFILKNGTIFCNSLDPIESALDLGLAPILYGDVILDFHGNFSILSGDQIILEMCSGLKKYAVSKVIFTIEKDGVYIDDGGDLKLLADISSDNLDNVKLAQLGEKIDVTGGIVGKLNSVKKICSFGVPVQIINGLTENNLLKALRGDKMESTLIFPPPLDGNMSIRKRKIEHLKIPLTKNIQHHENYFKHVKFIHHALPSIKLEDIDLTTSFFNRKISAPICISAITGGHPISTKINETLAAAAEKENVVMSVGSQRAAIEDPSLESSFSVVRELAPSIPIMGNLGIGQISADDFRPAMFKKSLEMIEADAMAIHFNPLHELLQANGDISFDLFEENFQKIRKAVKIPIIAKEVGAGLNPKIIDKLERMGFDGFDVGGSGGTSFAAIEAFRNKSYQGEFSRNLADTFRDWGLPTPVSIIQARKETHKLIIATGGLCDGVDLAKSIALGADIGGFASKFLLSAWKDMNDGGIDNSLKEIRTIKEELRYSLWLTNTESVRLLKVLPEKRVLLGPLFDWINQ